MKPTRIKSVKDLKKEIRKGKKCPIYLEIGRIELTEEVVDELVDALKDNKVPIENLDISKTTVLDKDCCRIVETLETNFYLRSLNIGKNIGLLAVELVVKILKEINTSLVEFPHMYLTIKEAQEAKASLKILLQRNNFIKKKSNNYSFEIAWSEKAVLRPEPSDNYSTVVFEVLALICKLDSSPEDDEKLHRLLLKNISFGRTGSKRSVLDVLASLETVQDLVKYSTLLSVAHRCGALSKNHNKFNPVRIIMNILGSRKKSFQEKCDALDRCSSFVDIYSAREANSESTIISWVSTLVAKGLLSLEAIPHFFGITSLGLEKLSEAHPELDFSRAWKKLLSAIFLTRSSLKNFKLSMEVWATGLSVLKVSHIIHDTKFLSSLVDNLHKAYLKPPDKRTITPEKLVWLLSFLNLHGLNFSGSKLEEKVLQLLAETTIRGEVFFNLAQVFIDQGFNFELENTGGCRLIEWLVRAPHCRFSSYGRVQKKTKPQDNLHSEIQKLLSPDRPRHGLTKPRNKNKTKRKSWKFKNFAAHRKKVEDFFTQNYPNGFDPLFAGKEIESKIEDRFDVMSFAKTVTKLWTKQLVRYKELFPSENKGVLHIILRRCDSDDRNLFEAINLICEVTSYSLAGNHSFADELFSCKGLHPECLGKFIPWLGRFGFNLNSRTKSGKTVLESILKLRIDPFLVKAMVVDLLLSGYDLRTTNHRNENWLHWLVSSNLPTGTDFKKLKKILPDPFDTTLFKLVLEIGIQHLVMNQKFDYSRMFSTIHPNTNFLHLFLLTLKPQLSTKVIGLSQTEEEYLKCLELLLKNVNFEAVLSEHDINLISALLILRHSGKEFGSLFTCHIYSKIASKKLNISCKGLLQGSEVCFIESLLKNADSSTLLGLRLLEAEGLLSASYLRSKNLMKKLLQGNTAGASVVDFKDLVEYLHELQPQTLKHKKKRQKRILQKLFDSYFNEDPNFFNAIKDLCKEPVALDLNIADDSGRVFRARLENDNDEEVRDFAKAFNAFDKKYRLEARAPVHKSAQCTVLFAVDVSNNRKVALKLLKKESMEKEVSCRELLKSRTKLEGEYTKRIIDCETNVIKFLEDKYGKYSHYLVMPRADRSLFDVIHTERIAGRNLEAIREIAKQAAKSLRFLNKHGVAHLDFKTRNFMRTSYASREWKLIDFDSAKEHNEEILVDDKCSSGYCAPEIARLKFSPDRTEVPVLATEAQDVFSFGVVLFELLSGKTLFRRDQTDDELYTATSKVELVNWISLPREKFWDQILPYYDGRPGEYEYAKEQAFDLLYQCLRGDPSRRISFDAMLNHKFFAKVLFRPIGAQDLSKLGVLDGASTFQRLRKRARASLSVNVVNHLFISYMQSEGSEIARNIYYKASSLGLTCWFDQNARRLTEEGMFQGVLSSKVFVLVLTKSVLFRPFCLKELFWAIKSRKKVVVVYENDPRFHKFEKEKFLEKWKLTENQKNFSVLRKDKFTEFCESLPLSSTSIPGTMKSLIENFIENNLQENNMIPYRRRDYELKAMIEELLSSAGFLTPQKVQLGELKKLGKTNLFYPEKDKRYEKENKLTRNQDQVNKEGDTLNFVKPPKILFLLPPESSQSSDESEDLLIYIRNNLTKLLSSNYELVEVTPSTAQNVVLLDVHIMIVFISPGFFVHYSNFLTKYVAECGDETEMILGVQDGWFQQKDSIRTKELEHVPAKVSNMFINMLEILPYRPLTPHLYENHALKQEVCLRIQEIHQRMFRLDQVEDREVGLMLGLFESRCNYLSSSDDAKERLPSFDSDY
eukprot:augustus_masked-scaffold_14-processed-gene-1.38-mRNA-1 protein AED:1.00 eAED:1.00 QI:0/-1/0/0/-1/1/1/0/1776